MLYLIGGASRAGKTILAERLLARHGISWFSLDVLRMGLFRGSPSLGLDPDRDDLEEADRIWPIIRAMCANLLEYQQRYCLEGVCLRPEQAAEAMQAFPGKVKACFLVYPRIDPARKVDLIQSHSGGSNDWLSASDPDAIHSWVLTAIARSQALVAACDVVGISCFDTGLEFDRGVQQAERFLTD